jgi:hypothetical protein
MIDTGQGNTGHITALGQEPYHYTIFYVQVDDVQAYLDQAASLGGKTLVPAMPIPTALSPGCSIPKGKRGRPLETRHKLNTTRTAISKKGAYPPLLQKEVLPRRQYPYSSRKPISNPQSRGLRGALENARRAHSPADAHGDQTIAPVAPFEFAQNRRRKFRARATQRMA